MKFRACLLVIPAALAACQSPPPFPTAPVLAGVPAAVTYPEREIPDTQDLSMDIVFPMTPTDPDALAEGVTSSPSYTLPGQASIVISVPVEEQLREERQENRFADGDGEGITSFKTTGYFNRAEQQIVRSLIGKGFTVLDRSKFEAKLRDMRVADLDDNYSQAKRAEMQAAKEKYDSGLLNSDQYTSELRRIERDYESWDQGAGRKPGEAKELIDNSELIRAAQSGDVQADFILQVKTFSTDTITDRVIHLTDQDIVDEACRSNPGLRRAMEDANVVSVVRPGFYGVLNAELFDVQTGAIVWVGEHRVESLNILDGGFRIRIPVSKRASNGLEINQDIRTYNREAEELASEAESLRQQIESGAFRPVLNESTNTYNTDRRDNAIQEYRSLLGKIEDLNRSDGPSSLRKELAFEYVVEPIELRPSLPTAGELMRIEDELQNASSTDDRLEAMSLYRRYEEFLSEHYSELAKVVSRELIGTIPAQ